jgi:O-acetyl-ADP-ribose deacetylase (regulator of RNase III)
MITKYIHGDIRETELPYIAHGVNCQDKMGSGVAKALYEKWEDVKIKYHKYCSNVPMGKRLATVEPVKCGDKTVYNCFTQYNYGNDGTKYVNYYAIAHCFKLLSISLHGKTLAIPKIGCGQAGGDWKFVEQLINDTVGHEIEIWVYDNTPVAKYSGKNNMG